MWRMTNSVERLLRRAGRLFALTVICALAPLAACSQPKVEWWTSTSDLTNRLTQQTALKFSPASSGALSAVTIDPKSLHQSILGLGNSLEHSSCYNFSLLPSSRRQRVLESLFHPTKGIGLSLMRVCIGTPDFTASPWYTYDDMPPGQTDPELKQFSIARDREYVLPMLKAALRVNPRLKFFASPWSPPAWMKTSDRIGGGRINPAHFRSFALYLARFIEAYRQEGIEIHAITIQNEPQYAPDTYPTCLWTAEEQRDFIRDHLGPTFAARKIATLIWCYDHNFNHPEFPATILRDPLAARYVDGTAFHHYEGKPEAMEKLRAEFPGKHVYFSEGSTFGPAGAAQIISYLRNGARSYNAWVTMIDQDRKPNPGPHPCSLTGVVLHRDRREVEYRFDYFMYGHFAKFIRPGAVRVGSAASGQAPANVAFRNADGSFVVVTCNPEAQRQDIGVSWNGLEFKAPLAPQSVATFRWQP